MKHPNIRPNHSKKEIPTNCDPDPHKDFCARCFAFNEMCPNTGSDKRLDKTCKL